MCNYTGGINMVFEKNSSKNYIFSKEVYLNSDERVEEITAEQVERFDGQKVKVAHSYLGYIDNVRIASSWCKKA